jgi:hypothetical protein
MDMLMVIYSGQLWISHGDPLGVNSDKMDIHTGYLFGYPQLPSLPCSQGPRPSFAAATQASGDTPSYTANRT